MLTLDEAVKQAARERLEKIEAHLEGDVAFFFGSIEAGQLRTFRDFIEKTAAAPSRRTRLLFFLNTPGGSAEMAEKMVEIIRHHYSEVYFIVPSFALSAGTILVRHG